MRDGRDWQSEHVGGTDRGRRRHQFGRGTCAEGEVALADLLPDGLMTLRFIRSLVPRPRRELPRLS